MVYILLFIIIGLIFFALHSFTDLSKVQKITITSTLLLSIVSALLYNNYTNEQDKKLLEVVKKFKQNKSVHCKNIEVNSTLYTLSTGTYTFIGKKETPVYGEMISASLCQ